MANILVSVTEANVNVTTTLSNVTITDYESNSIIGNVITTQSNVNVTNPVTNVIVTGGVEVSNIDVRAAFSNVSPILYDQANGIFSFDSNASFAAKTTDDLAEGNVNLYFTNARVDARVPTSIVNGNIALKQYNETIYNAGNIQGNATFDITNGTIQRATLIGNVTNITFTNAAPGTTLTLVLTQDAIGNWTTPTTSVLTNWQFAGNIQTINNAPLSTTYLTAVVETSSVKASIVKFTNADLAVDLSGNTTDDLAEGNVNLYFTTARARGAISATGDISYDANTGVISYTGTPGDINSVIAGSGLTGGGTSGDVTLNVGAGTGITVNADNVAVNMSAFSTTDLAEGTNLYYTDTRANSAIDTRVNKAFVDALGINYNSLANTPTNVSAFTNDAGYLIAANLTSLTANVNSVNGETGNVVLDTGDIAENGNLYYTTARANTAIDTRVNKAFVEGLGVSYTSLSDKPTIPTHTSNLTNDSGFITAATANVVSVNSETGVVTLDTGDIAENGNLYYTTDRANTAIGAYQGAISTAGNITTTANVSGQYILGNGAFLTGITSGAVNSVNGQTGNVVLDTDDISEGTTNLYYTTARANTAIADKLIDSSQKKAFNLALKDLYLTPDIANVTGGFYMPNIPGSVGDVLQLTGSDQSNWQRLTTANVDESGGNVYFSNARVDSHLNTATANTNQVLSWNGSDYDWVDQTGGGGGSGTVTQINTGENLTGGPITTTGTIGMANALANVNSITSTIGTNFTVNTDQRLIITERIDGVTTNVANVSGDGFAMSNRNLWIQAPRFSYSGTGSFLTYVAINGNTTLGSNVITGITDPLFGPGDTETPSYSLSNVISNSLIIDGNGASTYPFPTGTYVTQVDSANSQVFVSQNATANVDIATTFGLQFQPGMYDSTTGFLIGIASEGDATPGGNASAIFRTFPLTDLKYGYPATGFTPSNFDFFTVGTASDYSLTGDISSFFLARTQIENTKTVMNLPRGLVIGNGDLSSRAENDTFPSFGMNILWDGLTPSSEFAGNIPNTQLLIKQYTDNSGQSGSAAARVSQGPRIFFTASEGNKNQPYAVTYPKTNLELGRISFWSPTSSNPTPGSLIPPAYINAVTNRDMIDHNGGVGMYLIASPETGRAHRGLFIGHQLGNTLIASGNTSPSTASQPITFAPMWTSSTQSATGGSNSLVLFNNTLAATNYQWANVNYDNPTGKTGSRLSITNGFSTVSARNGNLTLALDRNDNGAGFGDKEWAFKLQPASNNLVLTEDGVIRTTFSGGTVTATAFIGDGSDLTDVRAKTVEEKVINKSGGTLPKGTPVYATGGVTSDALWVAPCDASNAATMPCIGVLATSLDNDVEGRAIISGTISGVDTSAFTAGDEIYVAVGGGYANVAPSGEANIVQHLGVVTRVDASQGGGIVNIDSPRDESNLNSGNIFIGDANNITVTQSLSSAITNTNLKLKNFAETVVALGNVSGDISSNINVNNGSIFTMTATGNITINSLGNAVAGTSATLIITQSTGAEALSSTMKFAGASKTLSTTASAIDIISVFYDGSTYYATLSKGYA